MTLVIASGAVFQLVALVQRHRVVCPDLAHEARRLATTLEHDPDSSHDVVLTLQLRDVRWMAMLAGKRVMRDAGVPCGGIFEMSQANAWDARWFNWRQDGKPEQLLNNAVARAVRVTAERHAVSADVLWAAIFWYLVGAMMEEYRDACLRIVLLDRNAS
ncbi:MAG: hypothetical protein EBT09_15105 [Actinobacteria bacterium]|nr:hypothetical protein [Actinomycetota bacterium]